MAIHIQCRGGKTFPLSILDSLAGLHQLGDRELINKRKQKFVNVSSALWIGMGELGKVSRKGVVKAWAQ